MLIFAEIIRLVFILMSGILRTLDGGHLCSLSLLYFVFFCLFTGAFMNTNNNNFPVGGWWYWMVANLLERRLFSYLNDPVSILSLSKCAFVCLNAILVVCILFGWGAEQAGKYCSRDTAKYSQFQQTAIKPYIRNLWTAILPPPPPPSLFCAFPPTPLLQSSLYNMLCYIQYRHIHSAPDEGINEECIFPKSKVQIMKSCIFYRLSYEVCLLILKDQFNPNEHIFTLQSHP